MLFEIFKGEVDPVLDIADLRNTRGGHGHATIADIKERHEEDGDKKAAAKELVTKVAPVYAPAAVMAIASTAWVTTSTSTRWVL